MKNPSVVIKAFKGLVTNADSLAQHPATLRVCRNLRSVTAGRLETRPGLRAIKWTN